jgi:hypothetical protein
MAIKILPLTVVILAALFFLLPLPFARAQNGETRFIQRLTWTGDEHARRYEVVIEEEGGGTYRELRRESTAELFIEVSLLPGKYRCRVIPHNFLNQPGTASQWMYIEVLAAFNPVLDDVLPEFFLSDTDLGTGAVLYEMMVSGKNLIPGAEIFLRGSGDKQIVPFEIQTSGDGAHVRLFFKKEQLMAGKYELIVINPGGLQTGRSGITFAPPEPIRPAPYQKKADIFLSAAWMPSFTVYDEGDLFGRSRSFSGATLRFSVVSANGTGSASYFKFNPGVELAASYNYFGTNSSGQNALHLWGAGLNLLALKRLPGDRMALAFRLGAGYSLLLHANMGGSFLLFVMDHWYLETGLDYAHWFTNPPYGFFRPWLGAGWRF